MKPRAILTDIEGTTSSIAFVHEVLFPYARARLSEFVAQNPYDTAPILDDVRTETGHPDLSPADCVAQLLEWQDADRKVAPLKTLQGMIWAQGYADGTLKGHVYADAVAGLRRWHATGIALYVYSSGSVAAQKLLFGHSEHGDLTPLFTGYYDTAIGAKRDRDSYARIAGEIAAQPSDILFLSDVPEELDAARAAGMVVQLLDRDDSYPDAPGASSFDTILPETRA